MHRVRYLIEALSSISQGVLVLDSNFEVVFGNSQFRRMVDVPEALVQPGTSATILFRFLAQRGEYGPGDPEAQAAAREEVIRSGKIQSLDRQRPNGKFLLIRGNSFDDGGYVITYTDATDRQREQERLSLLVDEKTQELRKANRELGRLAAMDPLLGIPNRRRFSRLAERVHAQMVRDQQPSWLMMLDVDHFKSVNDRYGHAAGDAVLQAMVATIREILRPEDHLARYGGEEFTILLPVADQHEAAAVAEKIRSSIASSVVHFGDIEIRVTVSIGIAQWHYTEASIEVPLTRADRGLYYAKHAGRNRCHAVARD
jgi:diguanylate cyclase (GGDEF)-like protein